MIESVLLHVVSLKVADPIYDVQWGLPVCTSQQKWAEVETVLMYVLTENIILKIS